MLTVLGWMSGQDIEAPLTWSQIRDFCIQVEHQLADSLSVLTPTQVAPRTWGKWPIVLIATALVTGSILMLAFKMRPPIPAAVRRSSLPDPVSVAAGSHPTPDGTEEALPTFSISANEVTIGQYAEFLEIIDILSKSHREHTHDHADQPPEKTSHAPTDWPALLKAAKTNGIWHNLSVTLDLPVIGVDWWDAAAYADWKQARLPSQEEWFAALTTGEKTPSAIQPGPWIPVTSQAADRTSSGLLGMAGSVSEWTSNRAPIPANPLGERPWVIIGGSYLKPGSNALSREWTRDRSLRRPDLGFRLVFDAK